MNVIMNVLIATIRVRMWVINIKLDQNDQTNITVGNAIHDVTIYVLIYVI